MAEIYEDYSPLYVGDTGKPFAPVFQEVDPATGQLRAVNLSGIAITMVIRDTETGEVWDASGPWTIDSAIGGMAHYTWTEEDVASPGIVEVQMTLWDVATGKPRHSDVKRIVIEMPLSGSARRRFLSATGALAAGV